MVRLNITMPEDLVKQLKSVRNKSRFIAQAIREKIKRDKKERMKHLLIEGYKQSAGDDKEINGEWEGVTLENGWENE